jgi:hypothetical protein
MKTLLFILVALVGITATVSGLLLISKPDGSMLQLQTGILRTTAFNNFLIPGLLLFVFVGGINLWALTCNIKRSANRYNAAIAGGVVTIIFVITEMFLIIESSWLQFLFLGIGLLTILTAYQLKHKWAV